MTVRQRLAAYPQSRPSLVSLSALERNRLRLDRLLGLWDVLVDPRVGIIRKVTELQVDDDEPNFFHYLSSACDTSRFTALRNFGNNGGVSSDRYVAIAKALGEAVERYCSAIFRYDDLILASYRDLSQRAIHPKDFALYSLEQYTQPKFPWRMFKPDSLISWTTGRSLVTGEDVLVPAAMVYVPFHYLIDRHETPIVQPISTGLACGCSFAEAAISGLCETIERDAFTITWQNQLSRPRIAREGLPASVLDLLQRYDDVDIDVELIDITTDIRVSTIMTIAISKAATSPAVVVAAASDASPEDALVKSLEELAHTRKFARQVLEYTPEMPIDIEGRHPMVQDQKHHLRFYCPQTAREFAAFAWAAPQSRRFDELPARRRATAQEELAELVQQVSSVGLEPIACDLTTPDIASLGLSVVRIVVPGLHPLFMGYQNRALGGRRLYEVPQKLGYAGLQPGQDDNPYPHPFP